MSEQDGPNRPTKGRKGGRPTVDKRSTVTDEAPDGPAPEGGATAPDDEANNPAIQPPESGDPTVPHAHTYKRIVGLDGQPSTGFHTHRCTGCAVQIRRG